MVWTQFRRVPCITTPRRDAEFYDLFDNQQAAINYVTMLVGCEWRMRLCSIAGSRPACKTFGHSSCQQAPSSYYYRCCWITAFCTAALADLLCCCRPADADLVYSREVGVDIRLGASCGHVVAAPCRWLVWVQSKSCKEHRRLLCVAVSLPMLLAAPSCSTTADCMHAHPFAHRSTCRAPGAAARPQGARLPGWLLEGECRQGPGRPGALL